MNVADMSSEVAEAAGLTRVQARDAVNAVFESMQNALRDGQEVKLGAIGKLSVKVEKARTMRGFGEKEIKVPQRNVVRFKAFSGMKAVMNPEKKARKRA